MPPEQASGRSRDVDARTDLWAVGATIFSLLSGQYVHDGENAAQVLIAVATTPARSLRAVLPDAPEDIVTIVDKALAFHNEDRWSSAVEMRAAVLEAQARLSPIVTREELGRIVRATAPGSANADIQSTPITPVNPSPSGPSGTARLPSHPTPTSDRAPGFAAANSNNPLPSMQATKRSEYSPDAISRDSGDSAARAMTSASDTTPPFRSKSPMLVGLLVVAAVAAIGGALAANRFAAGSGPEPTPSAAPPLASALPISPAAGTAVAPLSTASAAPDARDDTETPEDTGSVAAGPGQAKLGKISGRKPPRAGVSRPATGSTPESPTETAPPPALPSPPTATASPAPTPSTPTSRKPPPVLDRTSPFGP
jgi:serine/threonine-protein kinase